MPATKNKSRKPVQQAIRASEFGTVIGVHRATVIRRLKDGVYSGFQDTASKYWMVHMSCVLAECRRMGIRFEREGDQDDGD